jgi:hypothetical protein
MVDERLCERCEERPVVVGVDDPLRSVGHLCAVCADYYDNSVDICGCEPTQPQPEGTPSQGKKQRTV